MNLVFLVPFMSFPATDLSISCASRMWGKVHNYVLKGEPHVGGDWRLEGPLPTLALLSLPICAVTAGFKQGSHPVCRARRALEGRAQAAPQVSEHSPSVVPAWALMLEGQEVVVSCRAVLNYFSCTEVFQSQTK